DPQQGTCREAQHAPGTVRPQSVREVLRGCKTARRNRGSAGLDSSPSIDGLPMAWSSARRCAPLIDGVRSLTPRRRRRAGRQARRPVEVATPFRADRDERPTDARWQRRPCAAASGGTRRAPASSIQGSIAPPSSRHGRAGYDGWGDAPTPCPAGSDRSGQGQNESDEPLLVKIFVCVTGTSAGPPPGGTLVDPVL